MHEGANTYNSDGGSQPDGVIVVDKPADMTSAAVVKRIKRLLGARKVGHAGTLDPFATGVIVCPINKGTRLAQFFLHDRKTYAATLMLGIETDTQDMTGKTISTSPVADFSEEEIESVFSCFTGDIEQVPPAYSALKHNGVPLYRYARKGVFVQKPARKVQISRIDIVSVSLPEIEFVVECSSGTYIRTLCADIGKALGCGGILTRLDRLESSGFTKKEASPLDRIEQLASAQRIDECIIPMNDALRGFSTHTADDELQLKIRHGRPISRNDIDPQSETGQGYIKIADHRNRLLAVVQAQPGNKFAYRYCCVFH